ncbi:hypothetical protein HIM_00253 [Hirsutella minnesotensis 3608]|nr:hypothetical protein HIM_00253 [Hirsutella minnesotensis 3608]
MHRAASTRWLSRALRIGDAVSANSVPLYLCPAVGLRRGALEGRRLALRPARIRSNHTDAVAASEDPTQHASATAARQKNRIPTTCSGCGAFAQTDDPEQLGYFDAGSKRVRKWLEPWKYEKKPTPKASESSADQVINESLRSLDPSQIEALGLSTLVEDPTQKAQVQDTTAPVKPPVCDRCHNLLNYSTTSDTAKVTMYHPTVESLRETIEESPHKHNHIYHIIDAADFPMSLIPRLNVLLGDVPLRTRNRRSRASRYQKDRKTEMSFIITRSDLLAPTNSMVDSLMPRLQQILRDTLGRIGDRVRLGNLRCVSAKRGWWTGAVREDVWKRGGAGWMVGKVNVGKSQLFEAIYPKGRMTEGNAAGHAEVATYPRDEAGTESLSPGGVEGQDALDEISVGELLPPPQPAKNYPEMPIVSSLPGTTASPIRIPFGNGRGELIDLPGLARSDLDLYVKEEYRKSLIMKDRIVPQQVSVKEGKSLILGGGLIRITPRDENITFLMYNFTPIKEHLTATRKAIEYQNQTRHSAGLEHIAIPDIGDKMKHAGTFKLSHDVTKKRAGPLTRKEAVGLKVEKLPFRVVSTDILIEGVGYVEIVAQIRRRTYEGFSAAQMAAEWQAREVQKKRLLESQNIEGEQDTDAVFSELKGMRRDADSATGKENPAVTPAVWPEPDWPSVDVYSPEGRFVGSRRPIEGWMMNKPVEAKGKQKKSRPRQSQKGMKKKAKQEKKAAKLERRAAESANGP